MKFSIKQKQKQKQNRIWQPLIQFRQEKLFRFHLFLLIAFKIIIITTIKHRESSCLCALFINVLEKVIKKPRPQLIQISTKPYTVAAQITHAHTHTKRARERVNARSTNFLATLSIKFVSLMSLLMCALHLNHKKVPNQPPASNRCVERA